MMVKKILVGIGFLTIVGLGVAPALAADTGAVSATVTPKLISISASPDSVAYGIIPLSALNYRPTPSSVAVTNDGNVTENFLIRSTNATTTGGTWTLVPTGMSASPGPNQYSQGYSLDNFVGSYYPMQSINSGLTNNVGSGASVPLYLCLSTPTSTSVNGEYSFSVILTATE